MYSGRITFETKEHESVAGEPVEYYYEHTYILEIVFDEEYIYVGDEFQGTVPKLNVEAHHWKTYKRDGKLLAEDLCNEDVEFTMDDPGGQRLFAVSQKLSFYRKENPWLEKLFKLM